MKNPIFKGVPQKNNISEGLTEQGGLGQFADLRWGGLGEKEGVVFWRGGGVDTPMRIMRIIAVNAAKTISINASFTNPNLD